MGSGVFRIRYAIIIATIFALANGLVARSASASATESLPKGVPKGAEAARVWGYLDADGFKARIGDTTEEIVLIGVDLPEKENQTAKADCFGEEAMSHLRAFLPKKATIYLERDETAKTDRDADDRLPRYVWIPGEDGAKALLLNTKLVRDGDATALKTADTAPYHANLEKAQQQARDANRGLWGACRPPDGVWSGSTAEGYAFNFMIRDRGFAAWELYYVCVASNGSVYTVEERGSSSTPRPIDRNGFELELGSGSNSTKLAGTFLSDYEASGTLDLSLSGPCAGQTINTTWYVTRS